MAHRHITSTRAYKLRRRSASWRTFSYTLNVPSAIAEQVPSGVEFTCEATEDGILFRPVRVLEAAGPSWPSWMEAA